jgi:VanZ family protein
MAKLEQLLAAGVVRWLRLPVAARSVPPVALMGLLWWSSSREPSSDAPSLLRAGLHNAMHVVAYSMLGGSLLLALQSRASAHHTRAAAASFTIAVGYGWIDEWHQSFVPGRDCSFADWCADASGAALSLALLVPVLRRRAVARMPVAACLLASAVSVLFATW